MLMLYRSGQERGIYSYEYSSNCVPPAWASIWPWMSDSRSKPAYEYRCSRAAGSRCAGVARVSLCRVAWELSSNFAWRPVGRVPTGRQIGGCSQFRGNLITAGIGAVNPIQPLPWALATQRTVAAATHHNPPHRDELAQAQAQAQPNALAALTDDDGNQHEPPALTTLLIRK